MFIITTIHIYIFLICWFITEHTTIQRYINSLKFKTKNNYLLEFLNIFSCLKCLSFWIFLIVTQNLFITLVFSFISSIYQKLWK